MNNKQLPLYLFILLNLACGNKVKVKPKDQITFLAKLEEYKNLPGEGILYSLIDLKDGSNAKSPKKKEGAKFLNAMTGYDIKNWVGEVEYILDSKDAESEMRGAVDVNNSLCVLKTGHVKYYLLLNKEQYGKSLKRGHIVYFSGTIESEKSTTLSGGLRQPEFILSNSSVEK
jgi:hypothetical protein